MKVFLGVAGGLVKLSEASTTRRHLGLTLGILTGALVASANHGRHRLVLSGCVTLQGNGTLASRCEAGYWPTR
jgi:hypothetical protein